jgi:Tfp pilus assembly protein PilW
LTTLRAALDRARRGGADAGVTLMELVVAMSLSTIIGACALGWFLSSSAATSTTIDANITTASARNALQSWAALLQVADSSSTTGTGDDRLLSLSPSSISFNADLNNRASCPDTGRCPAVGPTTAVALSIRPAIIGGQPTAALVQVLTGANGAATSVLVPGGAAPAQPSGCLFTAFGANGENLGCSGLGRDQLTTVARIDIAFVVTSTSGHPQTYQTSATFTGRTS